MFTQGCFIKKNTKELRDKLKDLGLKLNHGKALGKYLVVFQTEYSKEWLFVASPEWDLVNMPNRNQAVDCGTNENLFLAISALRSDIDDNQWFTDGKDWYYYIDYDEDFLAGMIMNGFHKATPKELIKHFK